MSFLRITMPNDTDVEAEIEITQATIRLKRNNKTISTCDISGCEAGKCCVKDLHGETFNHKIVQMFDFVFALFNFNRRVKDRFKNKEFKPSEQVIKRTEYELKLVKK